MLINHEPRGRTSSYRRGAPSHGEPLHSTVSRVLSLRRLRGALLAAAAAAFIASPTALVGQAPAAAAGASAEASLGATALHGGASWTASAAVLLGLTPKLSVGGSGTLFLGTARLAPGSDLTLRTAFGGLVAQLTLAELPGLSFWLRALAGAGNAKVDLAAVGTRIAADNFGVFVPEFGGTMQIAGPLSAGAALGYRAVFGVDDLPGVRPSDLRGLSARILLVLRR